MRPIDADDLERKLSSLARLAKSDAQKSLLGRVLYIVGAVPTLTPQDEPLICEFDVVDTKTGEYPDLWEIALTEEWAKGLMYCDMDGFAIREDGSLILLDECGNCVSCSQDRFEIRRPPERQEDT